MKNQKQGIGTLYLIVVCIAIVTIVMSISSQSISNFIVGIFLCVGLLYFGLNHFKKAEDGTESFVGTCISAIYNPLLLTWTYTLHGDGKTVKVKAREKLHVRKGLDYKFEFCKGALEKYKTGKPVVINEFFGYEETDECPDGPEAKEIEEVDEDKAQKPHN